MAIVAIDSGFEDGGTFAQQVQVERLLHSAIIDPDTKEQTLANLHNLTVGELDTLIGNLQQSQLNPITEVGRYGQRELTKHIQRLCK